MQVAALGHLPGKYSQQRRLVADRLEIICGALLRAFRMLRIKTAHRTQRDEQKDDITSQARSHVFFDIYTRLVGHCSLILHCSVILSDARVERSENEGESKDLCVWFSWRSGNQSAAKSFHTGFILTINCIFLICLQRFNCFSRAYRGVHIFELFPV